MCHSTVMTDSQLGSNARPIKILDSLEKHSQTNLPLHKEQGAKRTPKYVSDEVTL